MVRSKLPLRPHLLRSALSRHMLVLETGRVSLLGLLGSLLVLLVLLSFEAVSFQELMGMAEGEKQDCSWVYLPTFFALLVLILWWYCK
jgi:hypothetical protein